MYVTIVLSPPPFWLVSFFKKKNSVYLVDTSMRVFHMRQRVRDKLESWELNQDPQASLGLWHRSYLPGCSAHVSEQNGFLAVGLGEEAVPTRV